MLIFSQLKALLFATLFYIAGEKNYNGNNISTADQIIPEPTKILNAPIANNKSLNEIDYLKDLVCSPTLHKIYSLSEHFEDDPTFDINSKFINPNTSLNNNELYFLTYNSIKSLCLDGLLDKDNYKETLNNFCDYDEYFYRLAVSFNSKKIEEEYKRLNVNFEIFAKFLDYDMQSEENCFFCNTLLNSLVKRSFRNEKNKNFINKLYDRRFISLNCDKKYKNMTKLSKGDILSYISNENPDFCIDISCFNYNEFKMRLYKNVYLNYRNITVKHNNVIVKHKENIYALKHNYELLDKLIENKENLQELYNQVLVKWNPLLQKNKFDLYYKTYNNISTLYNELNSTYYEYYKKKEIADNEFSFVDQAELNIKKECIKSHKLKKEISEIDMINEKEKYENKLQLYDETVQEAEKYTFAKENHVKNFYDSISYLYMKWNECNKKSEDFYVKCNDFMDMDKKFEGENEKLEKVIKILEKHNSKKIK